MKTIKKPVTRIRMPRPSRWFNFYRFSGDKIWFDSKSNPITLLEAFEKAIEKWKMFEKRLTTDNHRDTCGLCNKFILPTNGKSGCEECPVNKETGSYGCLNFIEFKRWTRRSTVENATKVKLELIEWKKKYCK